MKKSDNKTNCRKKVAIYVRVSTFYQIDKDSLPMQRKDLTTYSELILGIDDYEIFEDAGYSGKNTDRPKYQEMMARLRRNEFSHVLVWKIDRISRNLLDFAEMYEEFKDHHVTFVSKHEQFDTSTAIGEAMLKIILIFAELERNMTAERVTATMISRASNGLWNGGRIPYGYDYDSEKKEFTINDDEAKICRLIRDDYLSTESLIHVTKMLNNMGSRTRAGNSWSPTAVWKIASSPFYAGIYRYNKHKGIRGEVKPENEWVIVEDHHPAIFSLDDYEKLCSIRQDNLRHSPTGTRLRDSSNVFAGLLRGGKCGSKMYASPGRLHVDGSRGVNYTCRHRRTKDCDNSSTTDYIIGEFVLNYVLNVINSKRSFSKISSAQELEKRLLYGRTFEHVDHISTDGLSELYDMMSRYGDDDSYTFTLRTRKKQKESEDAKNTLSALRKEKEKQERALKRLQELYLYSDDAISEKDYMVRRAEITKKLEDVSRSIGLAADSAESIISDEDFIRKASHLLIQKELKDRVYIHYKKFVEEISKDVLCEYMESILDSVYVVDSKVTKIVFKNGLVQDFIYKKKRT